MTFHFFQSPYKYMNDITVTIRLLKWRMLISRLANLSVLLYLAFQCRRVKCEVFVNHIKQSAGVQGKNVLLGVLLYSWSCLV